MRLLLARALARLGEIWRDQVRHAVVLFASAFAGYVLSAIVSAQGVTGVPWPATLRHALDLAAWTTAAGLQLLIVTPATRRYGVGSTPRHALERTPTP